MKHLKHVVVFTMLVGIVLTGSGCGSLSLFSSRHVHYHASPDADKKIDTLEKRVEALETVVKELKK